MCWRGCEGRHFSAGGRRLQRGARLYRFADERGGDVQLRQRRDAGQAGGLVDWITDYTFNVNAYPNGGCPSIVAAVHDFCFRSYSQSFGQQSLSFNTQEWAGFVQDDWRLEPG